MAGTYDEMLRLIVSMKDEASPAIKKLNSTLDEVNRSMKGNQSLAESGAKSASKFSAGFSDAAASSRRFAVGMLAAGASIGAFLGYGVQVAGELEASEAGFKTLLGSAEAAGKIMDRIKKAASSTPFEIAGLTSAVQMMSSVTHDGDKALKVVLDLGEGLSAMGKGQAELDRVAVNLQQIGALGRANAVDIKQFAYAGLPIYDMLKEKTGLAGEALAKFTEEGHVTFDLLADLFDKANDKGGRFFGGFANQAGTFNQLLSNMKDSVSIFMSDFVKQTGLFDGVKEALTSFTSVLTRHKQEIIDYGAKGIQVLSQNIPVLAGAITGMLIPAIGALITIGGGWVFLLGAAGAAVGYLVNQQMQLAASTDKIREAATQQATAIDAMTAASEREINMLRAKVTTMGTEEKAYVAMREKEIAATNKYLESQKAAAAADIALSEARMKQYGVAFGAKKDADIKVAESERNLANTMVQVEKMRADKIASMRNSEMENKIRLGVKEYETRVNLLNKSGIVERDARNAILSMSSTASQKEISIAIDKAKRQAEITAQLVKTLAAITARPIIQNIQVRVSTPDSPTAGKPFASIGSAVIGQTKEMIAAGGDYKSKIEALNQEFAKAATGANNLSAGLDKVGGAGGGAGKGVNDAAKAAEKAKKEMESLTSEVNKNWKAYGDLKTKVKDALTSLEADHKEKARSITEQIAGITASALELQRAFDINMKGTRNDIASAYLDQVKKVDELKRQESDLMKEQMTAENQEKLIAVRERLSIEQKALDDNKNITTVYASEIAEAKRREQIGEFARFMEDIAAKRSALQDEYNSKRAMMDQEIKDLTDQRLKEQELFEQKKAELGRVAAAARTFATTWGTAMRDMTVVTQEKVNQMVNSLESLKTKLETVLSLQKQTSINGGPSTTNLFPARANGGPVTAGQGYIVGENGPEYFTPGRSGNIIPNSALGGGGTTIVINNPVVRDDGDLRAMKRLVDQALRDVLINHKI